MPNNILISGYPGVGKTTLIKKIIENLNCKIDGFFTEEKKEAGKRTGFFITDFHGNREILAHLDLKSPDRVGYYGVNVKAFEIIGIPALTRALENADLIVIDEIGKMEMFSEKFCKILDNVFDSGKPVIATIKAKDCKLTSKLKAREDVSIFNLTRKNRNEMVDNIQKEIELLFQVIPNLQGLANLEGFTK